MNLKTAHLCAALLFLSPVIGHAEVWAYQDIDPKAPLQYWTGNLGMDFDVVGNSITVDALGAYKAGTGSTGAFNKDIQVGIFNLSGVLQGAVTFTANTTYNYVVGTNDLYQQVTPFTLGPGSYSIVAVGFSNLDPNGNYGNGTRPLSTLDTGGGAIQFVGGSRYDSNTVLQLPGTLDGGPANRYDAGTFGFTAAPEPSTFAMLGIGAALLALARRKISRRSSL